MLLSHKKKFIYTKTIKTAGTSIEVFFERDCLPDGVLKCGRKDMPCISDAGIVAFRGGRGKTESPWYSHMTAKDLRDRLDQDVWNSYFKFCAVRNPYDLAVSCFYWRNKDVARQLNELDFSEIKSRFREWLQSSPLPKNWKRYKIKNEICVDYFIRYETLCDGIAEVMRRLGIERNLEELKQLKAGIRPGAHHFSEYFDQTSRRIVEEKCAWELDHFGYTIEGP